MILLGIRDAWWNCVHVNHLESLKVTIVTFAFFFVHHRKKKLCKDDTNSFDVSNDDYVSCWRNRVHIIKTNCSLKCRAVECSICDLCDIKNTMRPLSHNFSTSNRFGVQINFSVYTIILKTSKSDEFGFIPIFILTHKMWMKMFNWYPCQFNCLFWPILKRNQ